MTRYSLLTSLIALALGFLASGCTVLRLTPTPTATPTTTSRPTRTFTPTLTRTATSTITLTRTPTVTPTVTQTRTPTATRTKFRTRTATATSTHTHTPTVTETPTETPTITLSPTKTRVPGNYAIVVIDFPSTLESRGSYSNINGPVWVFEIKFREINGVAATISEKRMCIYALDGTVWGDETFEPIYELNKKVTIRLRPYGEDSYTSWVNSPECQFCGATMIIDYKGEDERGNAINIRVRFLMAKGE